MLYQDALLYLLRVLPAASIAWLKPDSICQNVAKAMSSSSSVYYPGETQYTLGIRHWATSSEQHSRCVAEPGTPFDVGKILSIVGDTRTPFAVKGGGHASNPRFSSTTGIHISMARFKEVVYNKTSGTVEIGAGLLWDDVYDALEPYGVNVVGARVLGVGVAGLTLGGGYSWKTNQYGPTVDTAVAYELVKPDGSVSTITHESDPLLFMGLKGGGNNFGIITKFTLKAFPQTRVWGGTVTVDATNLPRLMDATAAFSAHAVDPKAEVLPFYQFVDGAVVATVIIFYDGPQPPAGVFDRFLDIPSSFRDLSTRSFLSMIRAISWDIGISRIADQRVVFNTASIVEYSPNLLDVIVNETRYWGHELSKRSATSIWYAVEPFLPTLYTHNTSASAFPPTRSLAFTPFCVYYVWSDPADDGLFHEAARSTVETIRAAASKEGQTLSSEVPLYPNYAIFDTPVENLYGENLPMLRQLKNAVDPQNVMGLAGGFKI